MNWPVLYVLFPGVAREALTFYQDTFGGDLELFTYADLGRGDGPPDAIGHGTLTGPVTLHAADAGPDEDAVHLTGAMLSVLGSDAETLRGWFDRLAEQGRVVDPLQERPWGDTDGQVVDQFGLRWLVGFPGR